MDTPEPLRNLADLIAAQLEYHKKAYEILSELAPVVDGLQVEQEASYRYVVFRYRSLALERIARRQGQGDIKVLGPVTWLDS